MRLTLEKVLILKNVPLFANIQESVLSDIVAACEEISVVMGTDIIQEEQFSDDLYIVLQGQVRIHQAGQTIRELSVYDTFGELSALDPVLSDVTVTTLEDTTLFKISGPTLYRLMNEHKALEKSIISLLCKHIRQLRNNKSSSKGIF
ncbi:MAG: cyclic nucleotide-binding domain-containing protein [Alphaproteobacteria bacterium]|nr:cyclic nucleotide-binding domain-containing protein [Alphaproteobacteria bacterium]